jgi:hypothetical protein
MKTLLTLLLSLLAVTPAFGQGTRSDASSLGITCNQAAGVPVNCVLPAPGPNLFHYITLLEIRQYATSAQTGAATPIVVAQSNLPGGPGWTFQTALAIGTSEGQVYIPSTPIKSVAANTLTAILCPGVTGVQWRVNIFYYVGP